MQTNTCPNTQKSKHVHTHTHTHTQTHTNAAEASISRRHVGLNAQGCAQGDIMHIYMHSHLHALVRSYKSLIDIDRRLYASVRVRAYQ